MFFSWDIYLRSSTCYIIKPGILLDFCHIGSDTFLIIFPGTQMFRSRNVISWLSKFYLLMENLFEKTGELKISYRSSCKVKTLSNAENVMEMDWESFFILKVYIQRIKYGIYKMAGLQISTGYQTKSDVKTVVSNAKSPYTWQSWPTCFWVVRNTLLTMQDIILLCLHYLLFYSFLILFMILHVFFSSNIGCHSYKEFFDYSFMYKFSSTL